jgi:hypothetical protein
MFKLELFNVGRGFQTLGRGAQGTGPLLGLARQSSIELSAEQYLIYEHDIRYFHTAHCGEVRMQLRVDGEVTSPDDVHALCSAGDINEPTPSDAGQLMQTVATAEPGLDAVTAPTAPMTVTLGARPAEIAGAAALNMG